MNCVNREKTILLYYKELPQDQIKAVKEHIESCKTCKADLDALEAFSQIANITPSASVSEKILSYAASKNYEHFSFKEKILSYAFSFAIMLLFVWPLSKSEYSLSYNNDLESAISNVEQEISDIKYDSADFTESQFEYKLSISKVEKVEEVFREEK